MFPIALFSLLLPMMRIQDGETYVFRRTSATYVVNTLTKASGKDGLVPKEVGLTIDEAKNTVKLVGPKEMVESVKRYFTMLDVQPKRVEILVEGELPLLKYNYSSPISVANNANWTLSEPQVGLELKVSARINDDGYVAIFVAHRSGGVIQNFVVRTKKGETVILDQMSLVGTDFLGVKKVATKGPPFVLKLTNRGIVEHLTIK